jgi:hypothetical protein
MLMVRGFMVPGFLASVRDPEVQDDWITGIVGSLDLGMAWVMKYSATIFCYPAGE